MMYPMEAFYASLFLGVYKDALCFNISLLNPPNLARLPLQIPICTLHKVCIVVSLHSLAAISASSNSTNTILYLHKSL